MSAVPPPGGFLARVGSLFGGGLGAAGLTPEQQLADERRAALFQAGLATLAGAQQPGATLGGSLFGGLQAGSQSLQGGWRERAQSQQFQRQQEREDRLQEQQGVQLQLAQAEAQRKLRTDAAGVASRVASGLATSKDPLAQFQYLSSVPEVQSALSAAQIDPSTITTPEALQGAVRQLAAFGQAGAVTPRVPLDLKAVIGKDGKPRYVTEEEAIGQTPYSKAGLSVTLPDGTTISDGPGVVGPSELTNPTKGKLQNTIIDSQERLDRLNQTLSTYKPEFLQAQGLIKAGVTRLQDFVGADISPEQKKFLGDYSEFRANAISDFNATLKDLSGTAASDREVERVRRGAPSQGDRSPTEFEGKARATVKNITRIIMRSNYALKNGIGVRSGQDLEKLLPLEGVDAIYEARVNEIFDQLGGTDDVRAAAIKRANQEFGLAR